MKGPLGKLGITLTSLMASIAMAGTPDIPSVKVDDGRPSLARTHDEDNRNWYLSVPVIPQVSMTDLSMTWNGYDLVEKVLNLEVPDIQVEEDGASFNEEGINKFMDDLKQFPNIDGNLSTEAKVRFGILTKYVEVHAAGGVEGRADFKLNAISGDHEIDSENKKLELEKEQTIFESFAYADVVGEGRIVVPVRLGDFVMKPFVGGGYKYREALQGKLFLPQTVKSNDDIMYTSEDEFRSSGQGFFFNLGILADFSKLEDKYVKPIVAVTVDNVYSQMRYSINGLGLPENDPLMLNVGLQISPVNILNLRADFLDILNNPEIRVEAERTFGPLELAVFGRLNERTLLGERRNSVNAYVGLGGNVVDFGICGSYDDANNFGAGLVLNLGWHPEMK